MCVDFTNLWPLWVMFLWVVQKGGHVIVEIRLKTVDQVPASKNDKFGGDKNPSTKGSRNTLNQKCIFLKILFSF